VIRVHTHGDLAFLALARRIAGMPVYWTGAYYWDGVLLDCGPPVTAGEVLAFLDGRPLHGLLVTHHHEDHMGAAARLLEARGVRLQAHPAALPLIAEGYPQEMYRRFAWGAPPRLAAAALGDEVAAGGRTFRVVHTPGHSPDHVCFFEPDRGWLFTGDLFLAERLRYLRSDEDVTALVESLDAVCRLPLREVFCAHRGPLRDGPGALRRKRDGLVALREQIRDLLGRGLSESEITRRVVGPEGGLTWFSLGRFSARNFVRAVVRESPREGNHGDTETRRTD
jgi:glyoxylase-like metal-dependent hydrolase (beta-lactamase superfamily II)